MSNRNLPLCIFVPELLGKDADAVMVNNQGSSSPKVDPLWSPFLERHQTQLNSQLSLGSSPRAASFTTSRSKPPAHVVKPLALKLIDISGSPRKSLRDRTEGLKSSTSLSFSKASYEKLCQGNLRMAKLVKSDSVGRLQVPEGSSKGMVYEELLHKYSHRLNLPPLRSGSSSFTSQRSFNARTGGYIARNGPVKNRRASCISLGEHSFTLGPEPASGPHSAVSISPVLSNASTSCSLSAVGMPSKLSNASTSCSLSAVGMAPMLSNTSVSSLHNAVGMTPMLSTTSASASHNTPGSATPASLASSPGRAHSPELAASEQLPQNCVVRAIPATAPGEAGEKLLSGSARVAAPAVPPPQGACLPKQAERSTAAVKGGQTAGDAHEASSTLPMRASEAIAYDEQGKELPASPVAKVGCFGRLFGCK
eukprot:gene1014-3848_t